MHTKTTAMWADAEVAERRAVLLLSRNVLA
jgi:hypothetical protein